MGEHSFLRGLRSYSIRFPLIVFICTYNSHQHSETQCPEEAGQITLHISTISCPKGIYLINEDDGFNFSLESL